MPHRDKQKCMCMSQLVLADILLHEQFLILYDSIPGLHVN